MAPGAELYLAAMDGRSPTIDQLVLSAHWLAAQGVDIISFSGGTHEAPHNGKSQMDGVVEKIAASNRILWVNAAGNEGASHLERLDERTEPQRLGRFRPRHPLSGGASENRILIPARYLG